MGDFSPLCIYHDDPKVTPAEKLRTDVCMVMPVQVAPKGDVGFKTLPAGRYAIFLYKGTYDNLQAVYDTIYGKCLPEMECTLRDEPSAERYLNNPCETAPEELLTEIYIPVDKKDLKINETASIKNAVSFYFRSSLPIRGQLRRTDNLPLFYLLFISVKPYPVSLAIRKQGKPASALYFDFRLGHHDFSTFPKDFFPYLIDVFTIKRDNHSFFRRKIIGSMKNSADRFTFFRETRHLLLFTFKNRKLYPKHCFIEIDSPVKINCRNLKKCNKLFHFVFFYGYY